MADMEVDEPSVKKEGKDKEGKQRFEVKKVRGVCHKPTF
jgi:hypothetical protein